MAGITAALGGLVIDSLALLIVLATAAGFLPIIAEQIWKRRSGGK